MTEKISLGIDDETSPGLNSVEKNLNEVSKAADKAEKELNQAGAAAKKTGDEGSKGFKGMSLNVISLNQALEIGKKLIEGTKAAITALAADGSPAFVELNAALEETYQALLKIADDPEIQNLASDAAQGIRRDLIPAMQDLSIVFGQSYANWSLGTTALKEYFGFVEEGAAVEQVYAKQNEGARRKEIADKREKIAVDDKIADIAKKIAEETELRNIAQSNSRRQLLDLAEEETDLMREQERAGTATAKTRQDSLKRIELIQRRLIEVAKNEADAEIKEVERVAQERVDAHQRWLDAVKAGDEERQQIEKDELDKKTAEANAAADRLLQSIEQAKGPKGGNLLDETRANISPEATRAQLVKQAQEAARQKFIEENRDKVDLEGRASGHTDRERFENQRAANRQIALAQRKAGSEAFRDFNAGKTSQEDIAGAQNSLIQSAAQQAQSRGQLDGNFVQALTAATRNQQEMVASQEQLAQQVKQLQAALSQVGNAAGRNNAQSRRSLLGN